MKPTKSDYEYFFNTQFANSMSGLNKNRPYASFGPITIKYEPTECGPFTEIKWGVYLFDAEQKFRLPKSTCPIGNLNPVLEQHFDYMPFAQEIWHKYGDQICTELDKYFNIAKAYKRNMTKHFNELAQAIKDLYFKDGERILFDGFYKIASWCEEGDWQYVVQYLTEDDEWEDWDDCSNYFCYYDHYTKETTSLQDIAEKWIFPFFIEDLNKLRNKI